MTLSTAPSRARFAPLAAAALLATVTLPVPVLADILPVAADNFTSASSQTTNYGANTKINIEGDGNYGTKNRIGYFRFDLSTYTGGTISGAIFTLFPKEQISSTPQSFDIFGISDGGASENFVEGVQTWSNSGYAYGSGEDLSDSANYADLVNLGTLSGVTDADEGGSVTFSSAALDSFLNSDGNGIATFLVYNTNGTGSYNGFDSRETGVGTGATLTVVPEPSTLVMAALGLAAVLGLTRKRRG